MAHPDRFSRLSSGLAELGPDYEENVGRITRLAGELLGAACALYNRLDGDMLCSLGRWHAPPGYDPRDRPDGHICYDVIKQGRREPLVIRDLPSTPYASSDPNVSRYGLRTYAGVAVRRGTRPIGSLCVVFHEDKPIEEADGTALSILAAALSGEENRRQAVESLRESEEKFRAAFDLAMDPIFWADARTGILMNCNRAAERLLGLPRDRIIGRHQTSLHPPDMKEQYVRHFRGHVQTGAIVDSEAEVMSADGRRIPVWISAATLTIGGKEVLQGIFRDITERRRLEQSIQDMHQQRLESLGTLAGGIAHDFNNLLTGVMGNLSLLKEAGPGRKKLFAEMEASCQAAKSLASELLTFAKGEKPAVECRDLGPLVREAVRSALSGSRVECVFEAGDGTFFCMVDQGQMVRAFQNLVLNSVQAMPKGGTLKVGVSRAEREIRVTLQDSGPGIASEILSRLFDPFFSTKGEGHGLGLAVCRSIIAKHGGSISAASEPGCGAAFTVCLPAAERAKPARALGSPSASRSGSRRILVMDDDTMVVSALTNVLRSLGCTVKSASRGEDALHAWRKAMEAGKPFAAAILDLTVVRGMGGKETVKRLKELDPGAKAIVSSGYATDPVMAEYEVHGFSGVLGKPYRVKDVAQVLDRVIGRRKKRA